VDVNQKDEQGWPMLLIALDSEVDDSIQNDVELTFSVVVLLLKLGANISAERNDGKTVFDLVSEFGGSVAHEFHELVLNK